jgi:hypothetical protein
VPHLSLAVLADVLCLSETILVPAEPAPTLHGLCALTSSSCSFRIAHSCKAPSKFCAVEKLRLPYSYCTPLWWPNRRYCPNRRCGVLFTRAEWQANVPPKVCFIEPKCRIKVLHHRSTSAAPSLRLSTQVLVGDKSCQRCDELFLFGLEGLSHRDTAELLPLSLIKMSCTRKMSDLEPVLSPRVSIRFRPCSFRFDT